MGRLRNRDDDNSGDATLRFQMREKMFDIGDDAWIDNAAGEHVFKVNGKALRLRKTFILEDAHGNEAAKIQEKAIAVRDKMRIEMPSRSATVAKRLIGIRDRFTIEVEGGPDMSAMGNFLNHEYEIEADGNKVAEVSRKWFRVRDTYGVDIAPGADVALILAVTVAIDELTGG